MYILGDYSVYITGKVRKLAKGYTLLVIGDGTTDDVQCNDSHVHHILKKTYRMLEAELMIEMLRKDQNNKKMKSKHLVLMVLSKKLCKIWLKEL